MKETVSVLIPDGESSLALFVAHCLSSLPNVEVHALSTERWSPLRFSRYCRSYTFAPHAYDSRRFLESIAESVERHKVHVLLPVDTSAISFAISQRASLCQFVAVAPLPDQHAFEVANNKWLTAQFLAANDLATPPTLLVDYSDGFFRNLDTMDFPVLLKPTRSRGGEGIRRFGSISELKLFLNRRLRGNPGDIIVQSVVPGADVSINALANEGRILAVTAQQGIVPNTQKFGAPGGLQFVDAEFFPTIVEKLVAGLPWTGYVNIDTLFTPPSNVHILDINARFWASLRGSWVAGVNFPYIACLAALHIPFDPPHIPTTRYFHPKTAIREFVSSPLRRHGGRAPSLKETDLNFLVADPIAETLRIFYQEILDR